MNKRVLSLVVVTAMLALPMSQSIAAQKPVPPGNAGGMGMDATKPTPAMGGYEMMKMRVTPAKRTKAVDNAVKSGKPKQITVKAAMNPANGPDYFGSSPNYASSPLPKITWVAGGGPVVLPIFDPESGTLIDPRTDAVIDPCNATANPYLITGTCGAPNAVIKVVSETINDVPQLDLTKVEVAGGIRKFIEPLPGIGAASTNGDSSVQNCVTSGTGCTTAYLPVAVPDTAKYPGADYYEIGLKDYYQQFSPDLPPTRLRGYYQINAPGGPAKPFYLGPVINARHDVPVRVKFVNTLPKGSGGDLFLPVDTTDMGAGAGPNGGSAVYAQNRATIHLHGGLTPWISDGTPHQWTTPAGDSTTYPQGVSVYNVPDMPDANSKQGVLTFYYTNAQSARLMWYHDHTLGMTRLNVYAGEVAGYDLSDPKEQEMVGNGLIPKVNIPLVIQDKSFVPDNVATGYFPDGQLATQDPTWNTTAWGSTGSLWFPHVYMPNQNPYDDSGAAPMGRWDYGPWFWPIFGISAGLQHGEVKNPYYDQANAPWEPPFIPGTPSTYTKNVIKTATSLASLVPETFVDTPVVNGLAYPYLNVEPQAYRFKILNGANDRFWNLQMYCSAADMPRVDAVKAGTPVNQAPAVAPMWSSTAKNVMPTNAKAGEVPMVPAVKTVGYPAEWPTDGRAGGVPDPAASAGNFLQIGSEGGFLPQLAEIPNHPVSYNYNRRDIVVLNVDQRALYLGPAERADVVFDFSEAANKGCTNVILYNDAPAPVPAFDPRNDYYTNAPDLTESGGVPSTLAGYGPNTRTIMQFRINQAATPQPFTQKDALAAELPKAFALMQDKPIVPNTAYAAAYPGDLVGQSNVYARIQSNSVSFQTTGKGSVASLVLTSPGSGYTPTVKISGGGGTGATATAVVGTDGSVSLNLTNPGSGYRTPPTVTVSPAPAGGTSVQVSALIDTRRGRVTGFDRSNAGSGYTSGATVTFSSPPDPNMPTATADATVDQTTGKVTALTLVETGSGYPTPPTVTISTPPYGGVAATATATLGGAVATATINAEPKAIQELFEMNYGRMNATLGVELPFTNSLNQTTLPMGYAEPATEYIRPSQVGVQVGSTRDGTEIWKITHNGVDTHAIHFHLENVQVLNRVGWDGAIRPPDPNEMGWKETVRMNPLEDAIVAMRPTTPEVPFKIGDSIRVLDPTMKAGDPIAAFDPATGQATTIPNDSTNYGWEYVWHCHLLGHEENDMMRPVVYTASPSVPTIGTIKAALVGTAAQVNLDWTSNANWQLVGYVVQRSTSSNFSSSVETLSTKSTPAPGAVAWQKNATLGADLGKATSFTDTTVAGDTTYYYRVRGESVDGYSQWSDAVSVKTPVPPVAPTSAPGTPRLLLAGTTNLSLSWWGVTASPSVTGYTIQYTTAANWGSGIKTVNSKLPAVTLTGLTTKTKYYVRVAAVNSVGTGPYTNNSTSFTTK